jgi:DNA invertase Pin-like site-specific DNA recombinase
LGYVVVEEHFDDEGCSGATLDRPAFQRLLVLIRSGGIDRLVIYRLDRLSRNLRHFVTLFEELLDHDVSLDVVTSPELAASRVPEGRAHLKAHGRRIAGAVPFTRSN